MNWLVFEEQQCRCIFSHYEKEMNFICVETLDSRPRTASLGSRSDSLGTVDDVDGKRVKGSQENAREGSEQKQKMRYHVSMFT